MTLTSALSGDLASRLSVVTMGQPQFLAKATYAAS